MDGSSSMCPTRKAKTEALAMPILLIFTTTLRLR